MAFTFLQHETSVHLPHCTVDIRGVLAAHERNDVCELFRLAGALLGNRHGVGRTDELARILGDGQLCVSGIPLEDVLA